MSTLRAPLPIHFLYVSKTNSPVRSSIQRNPKYCSEIPQREYKGKNYVQISLNFYSKHIKTFFSLYLSYHFFLSLNICIKFCDDLHSVIGDFQTLYLVIMIESFLEKKRGPDLGNKTSRFLKLNRYNTVKIKRNMKLLFYRRW